MNPRAQRTAAELRHARLIGAAGPRRRLPRQIHPNGIAREYSRELRRVVALTRAAFAPLLAALPALLESAAADRRHDDARTDAGEGRRIRELVAQAKQTIDQSVTTHAIDQLATKFAQRTATYQRIQLNRQTRAALGADVFLRDSKLMTVIEGFAAQNVALIKNIPDKIASDIEMLTTRAVQSGTLHGDLAKELAKTFDYGDDRAKLIARDQVGKLYGQINATRQEELGIESFIWRTVEDERVRPEHEVLDGEEFKYSDPPDEGLPGEPILCRCYAEPVFGAILDDDS